MEEEVREFAVSATKADKQRWFQRQKGIFSDTVFLDKITLDAGAGFQSAALRQGKEAQGNLRTVAWVQPLGESGPEVPDPSTLSDLDRDSGSCGDCPQEAKVSAVV
jgi:hypothetical protein